MIIPTFLHVNTDLNEQDILIRGPSSAKSPRKENRALEELRASLKDEITSKIKGLLAESHKELLKLLKHKSNESIKSQDENHPENQSREFHTPTRSVRMNSTSNDDATLSGNMVTGVLTDSTNHPKRSKIRSQSQPASKERPVVARTLFGADRNDNPTLPMPKPQRHHSQHLTGKLKNLNFSMIFSETTSKGIRTSQNFKKSTTFTPCYEETPHKLSAI